MSFFKKKNQEVTSPVTGEAIPLSNIEDEVFSKEMMGKGMAIIPSDNVIYAPLSGVLTTVFPTGHAIGITTRNGSSILIHIGVDTVNLEGKGFNLKVNQGDKVKAGEILVEVDLDFIKQNSPSANVIVVVTPDSTKQPKNIVTSGMVNNNKIIMML